MTLTRFAPSPTGLLHVGNLRIAVVNALAARAAGGRFALRFDDTDPSRSEPRFAEAIRADLRWLGLAWDMEFAQSARLDRYAAAADALRAAGRLYPCWETAEQLDLRRRLLRAQGRPPVYDRAALALSDAERARLSAERPPHWRFRLEDRAMTWDDAVLGLQRIEAASVSDPVLVREDGVPLYTLASVVDDAETGVTDVVRGADHVTNTAVQIQIFEALGAAPPRFGHLSMLTGPGGSKLSKREGALSAADLRGMGVEPAALVAFLARLGTRHDIGLADVETLAAAFDLGAFGAAPVAFDLDQLLRLSAQAVRSMTFSDIAPRLAALGVAGPRAAAFWDAVRPNLDRLEDAADWWALVRDPQGAVAAEDADFVAQAIALLPPRPWDEGTWRAWTDAVKAASGRKGRALFLPLRRALTGRDHGPDMAALMPLLEKP